MSIDRAISTVSLPNRWSRERMMQLLGGLWFALLAIVVAAKVGASDSYWPVRLSSFCLATFYVLVAILMITRAPARAQAEGLLPRLAAFVGTYLPLAIPFFSHTDQAAPNLASAAFVLVGTIMMILTVRHLGRSFSLTPQARSVVQTGPYRWIRHPLYLSEEIAIVGAALRYFAPATVIIVVLHFGLQVRRILYEEDLLRRTCPEYSSYEASRWRLIPYVW
jgi:protein-S-isoprenylcysteine O-methyltransferase Ste14